MFDLDELECKFDVVYIDPPLEEYQRRASGTIFSWKPWTWDEVSSSKFSFNVHYVLFKGKYVNVVCKMKVERKMKVVCPTTMLWLNIIKKITYYSTDSKTGGRKSCSPTFIPVSLVWLARRA